MLEARGGRREEGARMRAGGRAKKESVGLVRERESLKRERERQREGEGSGRGGHRETEAETDRQGGRVAGSGGGGDGKKEQDGVCMKLNSPPAAAIDLTINNNALTILST